MWTCPECETRNEDNRKYCDCCGLEKRLIKGVVLPVDSVKDERKNYDQKKDWNQELTDSYNYDEGGSATKIGEKRSIEEVFSPVDSVKNDRKVLIRYILFGIFMIGVAVFISFLVTRNTDGTESTVNPGDSTVDLGPVNIADYVTFGHYEQDNNTSNGKEPIEWKVLDKKDGRALLLSKYGLDCKEYKESKQISELFQDVTWETCTLRSWLNSDFLNEAFSVSEKSSIPTVTLSNPDNPNFGTEGGNDTQDQVFLLSRQEVKKYFNLSDTWTDYEGNEYYNEGSKDVITSPTAYAKELGVSTDSDSVHHDSEGNESCWWWLRSPGLDSSWAACVEPNGRLSDFGSLIGADSFAVRPALWVNLAS